MTLGLFTQPLLLTQRPLRGTAVAHKGHGLTDSRRPSAIARTSGISTAPHVSAAILAQARLHRFALESRAWWLALALYRARSSFKCFKHQSRHHDWNQRALTLSTINESLAIGDNASFVF